MANWKNIGHLSNIPVRGARRLCLKHIGKPVAVFRTGDDEIYALVDECPHRQGPLSEGILSGRTVSCPLHNWVIGLEDGQAMAPDQGTAQSVAVRVVGGDIYIHLPEEVAVA
jgi:nitrite reductase (NADH) small subunit